MKSYSVFFANYTIGEDAYDMVPQVCPYGIIKTNGKTQCFQGFQRLSLPIQFLFQP